MRSRGAAVGWRLIAFHRNSKLVSSIGRRSAINLRNFITTYEQTSRLARRSATPVPTKHVAMPAPSPVAINATRGVRRTAIEHHPCMSVDSERSPGSVYRSICLIPVADGGIGHRAACIISELRCQRDALCAPGMLPECCDRSGLQRLALTGPP